MKILRTGFVAMVAWTLVSGQLLGVQRRTLTGHIPPAAALMTPTGVLPETSEIKLAIGLPLRNTAVLTNLISQMYDPADPNYRHFLSPQQFTERFGPTKADYNRLISFARTNGLEIVESHPNRLVLDVRGSVASIQRAFRLTLHSYPHPLESRSFYAPDTEPSVESDIPILDITGLNNFTRPRPKSLRKGTVGTTPEHRRKGGSGPNGDYMGRDFRAAYLPGVSLTGTGQIVGLLEFDGYYPSDITSYQTKAGLAGVPLENVLLDGFDGTPTAGSGSGNNEVALDIELTMAMAPGLSKILVYEAGPNGYANDIISRMASDNTAAQLSCSWDFGTDANATTEQIFLQFAAQGQCFFNASGDSGAYLGSVPSPDDDPYIALVGGTTLTTDSNGAWLSETTWNAGGDISSSGGFSSVYALPAWQQGISMSANQGSTVRRNIPDVAIVADQISIVADNGQQYPIYGTSAGAPLWAGITAVVNQRAAANGYPRIGFLNPALYSLGKSANYKSYFHDIISGNNTNSTSASRFRAAAGYDLCTGWGSPIGQNLLNALAFPDSLGIVPTTGFSSTGPVGGPFSVAAQSISLTNSSSSPLTWALENNATWINASPSNGVLAVSESVTVAVALNASAASLVTGNHSATLRFTNLTSGLIQSRQYTLSVGTSLVLNGGFESGDFSFWTLTAASSSVDDGTVVTPHTGNYAAIFGQLGSAGPLTQPLPTRAGQPYLLSFWLTSVPDMDNITTPNEFRASFDSKLLVDLKNIGILDWTNMQFLVSASSSSTILEFDFRDDPYYLGLDDVSVIPVPVPSFQSITLSNGVIQLTWSTLAGLRYQVQYQNDPTQANWNNLGTPVLAAGTTASASDPGPLTPARYYRVAIVPK